MYNQVNISSGHSINNIGMRDVIDEVTEARKVVDRVYEIINDSGKKCYKYHDTASTSSQNLANIVNWHNQYKDGIDVSIHFNANLHTDKPMGVEVCYYSDINLAKQVSKAIASAGGFIDRGAKERTGLYFLKNTNKTSILIEVCFGDSTKDCELYKENFESICQAIAKSLIGDIEINQQDTSEPIQVENIAVTTKPVQQTESVFDKAKRYNSVRCTELQTKLNKCGYDCGTVDGIYGVKTHNALGRMQSDNGLTVDYLAGNMTFKKLDEIIAKKSTVSSNNEWVLRLQKELNEQGYRDKNGNRLIEDGLVGVLTLSACPTLKKSANGDITGLLQEKLNSLGYSCGPVDKDFGSKTYNAVVLFQSKKGLTQDGIVGEKSWEKLLGI